MQRNSAFRNEALAGLLITCLDAVSFFNVRELKLQRQPRLRKRHLKSEVTLPQTLSRLLRVSSNSSNVVNCFLEMNSKRLYRSSGREEESRCLVFTSSTKREIGHVHVVVVQ